MLTTVQKWGNSLGVRIPKAYADELRVESGSQVDIVVREGALVVTPARRSALELSELLRRVTPKNVHREVAMGHAGREVS